MRKYLPWLILLWFAPVHAAEVKIAVAANFTAAMQEIAAAFARDSGHKALVSYGSTGKLYTQIVNNAPFAVFLAADREHPRLLHEQHRAAAPVTYAVGKLVLWSADRKREVNAEALTRGDFQHLALANPKTAPYGAAALQVLEHLGLAETLRERLVFGDSIAQAYQFAATGNAELGFTALAQVALDDAGARWPVPQEWYDPIRQDAVLLERGADNPAAAAFVAYLQSPAARTVIQRFGYETPE